MIWDKLRSLKEQQVTQVLTTHYMDEATQVCDRVVTMDQGKIIAEGSPIGLVEKYINREALEVRIAPELVQKAIDILGSKSYSYEAQDEDLVFFSDSADNLLKTAEQAGLKLDYVLLRRSTLEDVFLKLTGRKLRD